MVDLARPALDENLLENGDTRNVVDKYRYWKHADIVADLDTKRHAYHIAIENYQHDFNIGAIVRNANAFLAKSVHIVGKRKWNRRGAMVTDRYQHIINHADIAEFADWAQGEGLAVVGIDNIEGSQPIDRMRLPAKCVLLFGQEGPGLSPEAQKICELICEIPQFGSTRSINVGVASGIAMFTWIQQHIR